MKIIPAGVGKVVQDYIIQLNSVNSGNVIGVYLVGSVALGDYHASKSDIDFVTVINRDLTKDQLYQLKKVHEDIEKKYNNPKFNGYYITTKGIVNHENEFPSFFKNKMHVLRPFELKNFSLFELKFFSQCVYGLAVNELPIDVQSEDLLKELYDNINNYWTRWVRTHSAISIKRVLLILFPRLTEWGILGVARQLYTLNTGLVTSKLLAGNYCLPNVQNEFKSIMATAVEVRRLNKTELAPSLTRANQTLKCMMWMISDFNTTYNKR